MNTKKDVIVTNEYIHCSECKERLIKVSELEQKIDEDCDFHDDGEYELFCDICEEEKLVDIGIEFSKQVYIEEDERLFVAYTYQDNHNLTKYFGEYVHEGLPINAPYFSKDKLKVTCDSGSNLCLMNLDKVKIKKPFTEDCTITLRKKGE